MFSLKKKSCINTQLARELVLHGHIFKNAGTTIDWILERNFGKRFCDDREDEKMRSDPKYLETLIFSKPDLAAISSHSMPLPPVDIAGVNFHVIVLLRHPLLRIRSVYEFEKKQNASTLGAINAKDKSFREYVNWRMKPDVPPTIRNMQVRYLTKNRLPVGGSLTEEHLHKAIEFSDSNVLLGLVELFDESAIVFSNYFEKVGIEIDFAYKKQNVSARKELRAEEELKQLKTDLGDDLYENIIEHNSLDIELYDYCQKLLQKRHENIDGVEQKLEKLRIASSAL